MKRPVFTATPDQTVRSVINDIVLKRNLSFIPVCEHDRLLGFVSTSVLKDIDVENWDQTRIDDVFVASSSKNTIPPDYPLDEVFKKMSQENLRKLLVEKDGALLGIITLADLMTYLSIQSGFGLDERKLENRNHSTKGATA